MRYYALAHCSNIAHVHRTKTDIETPKEEFDVDDLNVIALAQEYGDEDKARGLLEPLEWG